MRHDAVLDPNTPTAHHVGKHHVSCQPVSHNGDVTWTCHAGLWVVTEIRHDLIAAARLLDSMRENSDTSCFFYCSCHASVPVIASGTSCVGYDKQATPRISCSEGFKVFLGEESVDRLLFAS